MTHHLGQVILDHLDFLFHLLTQLLEALEGLGNHALRADLEQIPPVTLAIRQILVLPEIRCFVVRNNSMRSFIIRGGSN